MVKFIKKLCRRILTEQTYSRLQDLRNKVYMKIDPKGGISMIFRSVLGYDMSWENPQDLNEKINWMKIYADTSEWVKFADKYIVRNYITQKGYKDILVPLIGKWDSVEDIDWNSLPNKFVMKMNNGSGDILICTDKSHLDIDYWKKYYKRLFKKKFGISMGEFHYSKMKPCIIAEELLDVSKQSIETTSLIDYKIWCFNGEVTDIWTWFNRNKESVQVLLYDQQWNPHPEHCVTTSHYFTSSVRIPKPSSLSQMIQIASDLSKGIPQVRIDFYEVDGKPYFGEMTFTSNSGYMNFHTREYMLQLGKKVKL